MILGKERDVLLLDGDCGLCHRLAQFINRRRTQELDLEFRPIESEEGKKDNGLGFVESDAKKLNVKVYKDEVDKLIKEYKKIKKARKSNLGQVKLLDKHGKPLK